MRRTPGQRKLSRAGFKTAAKLGPEGCHKRACRAALARFHPDQYAALKAGEEESGRQALARGRARINELLRAEVHRLASGGSATMSVATRDALAHAHDLNVAIAVSPDGRGMFLSANANKLPRRLRKSLFDELGLVYNEIWKLLATGPSGSLPSGSADHA